MGKASSEDGGLKGKRQRRLRSSSSKYLKPGALAQLRYNRGSAAKACTDLGKKRIALMGCENSRAGDGVVVESEVTERSPLMVSPVDFNEQKSLVKTPKTPRFDEIESESRLESLPMDLLVKVLCHLHHDQLKAVFHVSRRIRKAVCLARQFHFNYTTPDRSRQEMLLTLTPKPTERWPFLSKERKGIFKQSPHTPKAPRHGPRPPSRVKVAELRQIAAVLFQDSAFSSRYMVPPVLQKPLCKSQASNRVLFYEDELCQAVAQNKLL